MQLLTMRPLPSSVQVFRPLAPKPQPAPNLALRAIFAKPQDPSLPRDIASRFGRRIRDLRHARGLTQSEVAERFGIDRTFISDVERGRKGVCLPTLEVFALGFEVSLSELMHGL